MELSLIELLKPYPDVSISFQNYLRQVTNGNGNFIEFANSLSWRMQLGMVLEFFDIVYNITIAILPNGGAVIEEKDKIQRLVSAYVTDESIHPLVRYYNTIKKACEYIVNPF